MSAVRVGHDKFLVAAGWTGAAQHNSCCQRRKSQYHFVKGVATAITPMAFYETVMVKGYETLVDSGTTVDVNTGMIAAGRLQALIESRASGTRIADLMVQMDCIIRAIHSRVPEELWPEILCKIDGPVAADTPADEFEDWDHGEDGYEAVGSAQADGDGWTPCAQRASRDDRDGGPHHRGGAAAVADRLQGLQPSSASAEGPVGCDL